MKKKTVIIITSVALVIVLGLCTLTLYGVFSNFTLTSGHFYFTDKRFSAEVKETASYNMGDATTLEVSSRAGDIIVVPGDSDTIKVDMVKTAWGATEEEAKQIAENLKVTWKEEAGKIILTFSRPTQTGIFIFNAGGLDKIDMVVHVPEKMALVLEGQNGLVSVSDFNTPVSLSATFGDIEASNISGEFIAKNRNGDMLISKIHSTGKSITLETEFGDIQVEDLSGKQITISSRNGKIDAQQIKASDNIEINNEFGAINLSTFSCQNLIIDTRNGPVELKDGDISTDMQVNTEFGDITATGVYAQAYLIDSRNGDILLSYVQGLFTASVEFGDIVIEHGELVTLNVTNSNGKFDFTGSLDPEADHSIESRFSDVTLTIPADSAFDVDLETKFGSINSELEITLTLTGEMEAENFSGQINGGGSLLKITSNNGNINLYILEEE